MYLLKPTVALHIIQQYQRHVSEALPWAVYLDRLVHVVLIFVAAENGNLVLVRSMLFGKMNRKRKIRKMLTARHLIGIIYYLIKSNTYKHIQIVPVGLYKIAYFYTLV